MHLSSEIKCKNFHFAMIIIFFALFFENKVQKQSFCYNNLILYTFSRKWGAKMFILL